MFVLTTKDITVIEAEHLSTYYQKRYIIVNKETGEIIDDAQGYGYKSIKGAYAAFVYLNRDKSKDKEKADKTKKIKAWMKEHKYFIRDLDGVALDAIKGSDDVIDAKFIENLLVEHNLVPEFSAAELYRVWTKGKL